MNTRQQSSCLNTNTNRKYKTLVKPHVSTSTDDITGDRQNRSIQLNEHMTDEGNRVDTASVMHKCEAQIKTTLKLTCTNMVLLDGSTCITSLLINQLCYREHSTT